MLGKSKWAPGGANDEAEANAPAPPANAPTGPRDEGRRRGPTRGGKNGGNDERTNNRDVDSSGAEEPMSYRPCFTNDDGSEFGGMERNAPNADAGRQPLGDRGNQFLQGHCSFQSGFYAPSLSVSRHESFQPGVQQAKDESDSQSAERQADRKENKANSDKSDTKVPWALGTSQMGGRPRPWTSQVWGPAAPKPHRASRTTLSSSSPGPASDFPALPFRLSATPVTEDTRRSATQGQSSIPNPAPAFSPPSSRQIRITTVDGAVVEFRPKGILKKTEERKASEVERPPPMVAKDVSSSHGKETKGTTNEEPAVKSAAPDLDTTTETHVIGAATNPDIEARVKDLEDKQQNTHNNVDALEQMYHNLSTSVKNLKNIPVNPNTPLARPPASHSVIPDRHHPANKASFHVPVQGTLADTDFLFLVKKLAGRQITADEWDSAVKQIMSWDFGSASITSQNQVSTADMKASDSTNMDRAGTRDSCETQIASARSMERKKKKEEEEGEEREDAEEKKGGCLGFLDE